MSLRPIAPALALVAVIATVAEARGLAFYLVLVAIVAACARGLEVVGEVAEERLGLAAVLLAGGGLAALVAAAASRTPGLALLCVLTLGIEELAGLRPSLRSRASAAEAADAPRSISRAA